MSETTYAGAHVAEFKDATERREQTQRWHVYGRTYAPLSSETKARGLTPSHHPLP
jgi:hypothetical protein